MGTRIIGSGDLDFSIEEKKGDEIGELAHAFNLMTTNLKTVTASKADLEREVVERKLTEEALRESEKKFSTLFQATPIGISLATMPDGAVYDVNQAWLDLTGHVQKEEVIGKTTMELGLIPEVEQRERIQNEFRQHGSVRNAETAYSTKSGKLRNVLVNMDTIEISGHTFILSTNEDITERRKAMNEIESLAKFPKEDPDLVMRIAADGTIVYANPSSAPLLKAWGRQAGKMLPDHYRNLIMEALGSGDRSEIEDTSSGTIYSLIIAPIVDMGYVNIYGRDVTQLRLAENLRIESEQRFRDAIDHFPNVFVIYDADRRVKYVNSNGLRIMGLLEQDVIGRRDEEIFPPDIIELIPPGIEACCRDQDASDVRAHQACQHGRTDDNC